MRVELLEPARQELSEAVEHYEAAGKGLGGESLDEFTRALEHIQAWPAASQLVAKYSRRRRLKRFPYGVVHRTDGDTIFILAVMYLGREPGYWIERELKF